MELLCTKCRRLFEEETNTCPFCNSTETQLPRPDDLCLLSDTEICTASGIAEMLNQKGIPFLPRTVWISRHHSIRRIYVPYSHFDEAYAELYPPEGTEPPTYEDDELFADEEIDEMDISQLEELSLEELKAYKSKIMKTLWEIKYLEQKCRERTNMLLDMKEEAENLIEDLS